MSKRLDLKNIGKTCFLSGGGLLSFSTVNVLKSNDFLLELPNVVFVILLVSLVLTLGGSVIEYVGSREPRAVERPAGHKRFKILVDKPKKHEELSCFFCGQKEKPSNQNQPAVRISTCMECGKAVCLTCAFKKGIEMGYNYLRCPACAGKVY